MSTNSTEEDGINTYSITSLTAPHASFSADDQFLLLIRTCCDRKEGSGEHREERARLTVETEWFAVVKFLPIFSIRNQIEVPRVDPTDRNES